MTIKNALSWAVAASLSFGLVTPVYAQKPGDSFRRGDRDRDRGGGGGNHGGGHRPEPRPEPRPNPRPEPRPEPRPNPRPDPRPEPRPNPRPHPRPEPRSNPRPNPRPDPRPEPRPNPRPHPRPNPRPDHSRPRPERPRPPTCGGDSYYRGDCNYDRNPGGHRRPPMFPFRPHRPPPVYYPPYVPPADPYDPPYDDGNNFYLYCSFNGLNYSTYNSYGLVMGQEQSGWRTQDRCEEAIEKSTYYLTCAPSPDRERFIPTNTSTGNYVAQSWDGFMDREACFHSIQNQVGGDVCVRQSIGVFTAFDTVTSQPSYINSGSFSSLQSCIDNLR